MRLPFAWLNICSRHHLDVQGLKQDKCAIRVYATFFCVCVEFQRERLERNVAITGLTFQFEKNGIELLLVLDSIPFLFTLLNKLNWF